MFEYILQYNNATIIKKIKIKLYLFYKYMLLLLWKEAMIKDQDDIISMNICLYYIQMMIIFDTK